MNTSASPSRLLSRRQALGQLGGIAALGLAPGLSTVVSSARAATTGSYRALVCVFLYGGNDANNLIVPTDSAGYDLYRTSRGGTVGTPSNGALALPPAGEAGGVLPLVGTHFGVHPSMPELAGLWNSGNAAVLFNVGNLVQPFPSAAAFLANRNASLIPVNLYSHSDQQQQMQVTSLPLITRTGWAGRLIDAMSASGTTLPPGISAAGNALLLQGTQSMPTVVPAKGTLALNGFGSGVPSAARRSALQALLGSGSDSTLVQALGRIGSHSVEVASLLKPVLSPAAAAKFSANFANYATSSLSQQLTQVALLIEAATGGAISAPAQQIFFVDLNGFDTHNNQLNRQALLLADLSVGLAGFHQSLTQIGQADSVVTFTMSEFARTLKPASGGGSDHAWGSHHLVVGGSRTVRQGTYGTFPNLTLGGPSDVSGEGRWLPTTSVDQYGATLATWLGAGPQAIASAFPNLGHFPTANLGFLAS